MHKQVAEKKQTISSKKQRLVQKQRESFLDNSQLLQHKSKEHNALFENALVQENSYAQADEPVQLQADTIIKSLESAFSQKEEKLPTMSSLQLVKTSITQLQIAMTLADFQGEDQQDVLYKNIKQEYEKYLKKTATSSEYAKILPFLDKLESLCQTWLDVTVKKEPTKLIDDDQIKIPIVSKLAALITQEKALMQGGLVVPDKDKPTGITDVKLTEKEKFQEKKLAVYEKAVQNPTTKPLFDDDVYYRIPNSKKPTEIEYVKKVDATKILKKSDIKKGHIESGKTAQDDASVNVITENNSVKYKEDDSLLFKSQPSIGDIKQGGIGNCYLLAALISVVKKEPNFISTIMKDNGDKTVTVKFFDFNGANPMKEKFVKIKKETVVSKSFISASDAYAKNTLWVKLLEKAYAAAGFTGNEPAQDFEANYAETVGGSMAIAWSHLTGKTAIQEDISTGSKELDIIDYLSSKGLENISKNAFMIASAEIFQPSLKELLIKYVSKGNKEYGKEYAEIRLEDVEHVLQEQKFDQVVKEKFTMFTQMHIEQVKEDQKKLKEKFNKNAISNEKYTTENKQSDEDIKSLMNEEKQFLARQDIISNVMLYVEAQKLFPGKRGTGKYTEAQLELYRKIDEKLNANQLVGVGTKKVIARDSKDKGHSAGEDQAKGLAGPHAYSVLRCEDEGGIKYVEMCNPWGSYGREYKNKDGKLKAKANDKNGTFKLELSDLSKRFNSLYIGELP